MAVRSLHAFAEKQRAVRVLEVRRVLAENRQDQKCNQWSRVLRRPCGEATEYIVGTLGSKRGWFVCRRCLEKALRKRLLAPPEEYPERERERLEEMQREAAHRERERRRTEHTGCAGWSEKEPDNLCRRPPVARATFGICYVYDKDGKLVQMPPKPYCARHIVRFRRGGRATVVPLESEPPLLADARTDAPIPPQPGDAQPRAGRATKPATPDPAPSETREGDHG